MDADTTPRENVMAYYNDDQHLNHSVDEALETLDLLNKRAAKLNKCSVADEELDMIQRGASYVRTLIAMCDFSASACDAALEKIKARHT